MNHLKLKELLNKAVYKLKDAKIEQPILKARILMQYTLNKPREYLIIYDQKELTKQQRAKEQAEMRDLLKNKGKLEQKEADLAQREKEFQQATQGHIYAVSDSPASIEVEQPTIKNAEESLSTWEKMKRLKKAYEDGEITYEEYNEKRKHLT